MDRSWKDNYENPLKDNETSGWKRFKDGSFTVKNMGERILLRN